jgi:hypothetical protein
MSLTKWYTRARLGSYSLVPGLRQARRHAAGRVQPRVECLEDRRLLACMSTDTFLCTPLSQEGQVVHIHPHLTIMVNGQQQTIPANIGITLGPSGNPTSFLPIHTHDASGTIHVESPIQRDFHLKDFFDTWGMTFTAAQILNFRTTPPNLVRMTVDGQPNTMLGNLVLRNAQNIVITATNAVPFAPASLQFSTGTFTAAAGAGTASITVSRTGNSQGTASVRYATSDGTARAGVDYTAATATLNFANGETSKSFNVTLLNNPAAAGSTTVNLTLSAPVGATLGTQTTAVLTITRAPGGLQFSAATFTAAQSAGTTTVTVTRTGGTQGAVSVHYATSDGTARAGTDYTAAMGTLSFANGETSKSFTVSLTNDLTADGNRTVNLTLSSPTGGATLATPAAAVLTLTAAPPDTATARAYVTRVYRDFLRRDPDQTGLDGWARQLGQGATRTQILLGIQGSVECRTNTVNSLFQELLGRNADATSLNTLVSLLGSGTTIEQVRAAIIASPEYRQARAGSDEAFLNALYRNALNRDVDAAARSSFLAALSNGTTRRAIADVIFSSAEYRQNLAQSLYHRFLNRDGEANGVSFWAEQLRLGARDEQVWVGFVTSREYFSRATAQRT